MSTKDAAQCRLVFVHRRSSPSVAQKIAASRPNPPDEPAAACDYPRCRKPSVGTLTIRGNAHPFCEVHADLTLRQIDAERSAMAEWDPAPSTLADAWVLWSLERGAYWAPERAGYNCSLFLAGVYSERDARNLASHSSEAYPLAEELDRLMWGNGRKPGSRRVMYDWIGPNAGGPRLARCSGMVLSLLAGGGAS